MQADLPVGHPGYRKYQGVKKKETYLGAKRGRTFCRRKVRQWNSENVAKGNTLTTMSAVVR